MIIELGEWLPDVAAIDNPGLLACENLAPSSEGYMVIRGSKSVSTAAVTTNELVGGATFNDGDDVEDFCGDDQDLFRLTWNGTQVVAANASKSAAAYSVPTGEYWDFTQFGENVIAVNGGTLAADTPQVITVGTANFADLTTSPPKAKTCATLRDFVVFGGTYDATDGERKSRVWWSAFGDHTSWVPSAATQCDFQDLEAQAGAVQRICGGEDAVIVTRNGVFLMTYVGPPTVMRFDEIAPGQALGTQYAHSVIRDGNIVYFWSDVGPVAVDIKSGGVKYIAEGKCAEYFRRSVTHSGSRRPVVFRDAQYGAIGWRVSNTFEEYYYFPRFDQWSTINDTGPAGYLWSSRLTEVQSNTLEAPMGLGANDFLYSRSQGSLTEDTLPYTFMTGGRQLFMGRRGLFKEARLNQTLSGGVVVAIFSALGLNDPTESSLLDDIGTSDFTNITKNSSHDNVFQGFIEGRYHFFRVVCTPLSNTPSLFVRNIEVTDASPTGRY